MTRSLDERISAVRRSRAQGLAALTEVAGLDPAKAFRFADLRGADLRGEQLAHFDFTGVDFRGAKLKGTVIDPSKLRAARLDPGVEERVARTFHLDRIKQGISNGEFGSDFVEIIDSVHKGLRSVRLDQADLTTLAVEILDRGYTNESCLNGLARLAFVGWKIRPRQCFLASVGHFETAELMGELLSILDKEWLYKPSSRDLSTAIGRVRLATGINLIDAIIAQDGAVIDASHFLALGSDVHSVIDWDRLTKTMRGVELTLPLDIRDVETGPESNATASAFAGIKNFDLASRILHQGSHSIWTTKSNLYGLLFRKARDYRSVLRELAHLRPDHDGELVSWFWQAVGSLPPGQAASLVAQAHDLVPPDSKALATAYYSMPSGKHRLAFGRGLRRELAPQELTLPQPRSSIRTILSLLDIGVAIGATNGGIDRDWAPFLTEERMAEYSRYLSRTYPDVATMFRDLPCLSRLVTTEHTDGTIFHSIERARLEMTRMERLAYF